MTSVVENKQKDSVPKNESNIPTNKSDKSNVKSNKSWRANDRKLDAARRKYEYNYTYIPSIAMVEKLAVQEYPSRVWIDLVAGKFTIILINSLLNSQNKIFHIFRNDVLQNILVVIIQLIARWVIYPLMIIVAFLENNAFISRILEFLFLRWIIKLNVAQAIIKFLFSVRKRPESDAPEKVTSLQQYNDLFQKIKLPNIANDFQEDDVFAYMRVAGYNPVMIERVTPEDNKLESKFPVTNAQYQQVMGDNDSLTDALADGRLYLADYQGLEGAANGTFPKEQKYLYAPLALFAVPKDKGLNPSQLMRPVAIQCSQNPEDAPIVTPKSEKYAWLFAKTIVQIADANFHEALSHLGRTHLFVGRFTIATHRELPDNHPLSLLLRPHFQGTLAINDAAQESLIAPGGGVDKLLAATIDNSRTLVQADLQNYSFNEAMLLKQLKKRGVDDKDKLPVYPYRDDARDIWDAIHTWVRDYLKLYYGNDQAVESDTYLQNWARDVIAYDGARVFDFGEQNEDKPIHTLKYLTDHEYKPIQTLNYLIDAVTLIIFTASAQHAAVNFPQKDIMSYMPAVPLAGYQPASVLKQDKVDKQGYLNLLPPIKQAEGQLDLLYLLGSVYYTQLGHYGDDYFQNPAVQPILENFQKNLQDIETEITLRNRISYTYTYLLPSRIPQSINI
ncbi:MAG: lipoxygenase family protein [Calothrix sp. MO_167.B42]|nr:lipoxygenase family protein [Calothrix sp. MO_167.B42]